MEIEFRLDGPDSDREIGLLYDWLSNDRTLRRDIELRPVRERSAAGEMGLGLEAVLALISTGAALGQLPFSYASWRSGHRPSSQTVVIVHDGGTDALRSLREAFPDAQVRLTQDDSGDGTDTDSESDG